MADFLILRFYAPLISFGGVAVDAINPTMAFPAKSLVTGLIANALGFDHSEYEKIETLQQNVIYGVLAKNQGHEIRDYQTVDLGQDFLIDTGWTTWGQLIKRKGANGKNIHIRKRYYLADADYFVALGIETNCKLLTLDNIHKALLKPARPLFIGRKNCLPCCRIFQDRIESINIEQAFMFFLQNNPQKIFDDVEYTIWIPSTPAAVKEMTLDQPEHLIAITDERDWKNQIHTGTRFLIKKILKIERTTA